MEFKTQLHNSISKTSYTSTKSLPFHGAGQGAGNAGTEWTFVIVPMIKVAEELTEGYTIKLPQGKATLTIHILGFVDDKRHYVNNFKERILQHLLDALENSIWTWDELLTFVGGQLEMDKNAWYLIEWDFDSKEIPYIKE